MGGELIGARYLNGLCPRGKFSLIKGKIVEKKMKESGTGPVDELTLRMVSSL